MTAPVIRFPPPDYRTLARYAEKILRGEQPTTRFITGWVSEGVNRLSVLGYVVILRPQISTVEVWLTAKGWTSLRDEKLKTLATLQRPTTVYVSRSVPYDYHFGPWSP